MDPLPPGRGVIGKLFIYFFFFLLVFNLLTYRITPSARHPFTPTTRPPPLPPPLVRFPELAVFTFCLPFWYFPHISSPFPYIPFHYYLYSPSEWEHTMFVLLQLSYFTQHNTFQFHPRWSKRWVFVVSNVWARPTFSLPSYSESPMTWMLLF